MIPEQTPVIREVRDDDLPQVLAIYNHYVAASTVTFDEEPLTLADLNAKARQVAQLGFPFIVAEVAEGHVLGYAYVYLWRPKAAYRHTVECSIYLSPTATGRGFGRSLLTELLERSRIAGIREVIAVIADEGAEASIALHRSFGFREIGHLGRVGYKFERWLGTILLQKSLVAD
jgi:L-amino acid N-acyltransferase YncA